MEATKRRDAMPLLLANWLPMPGATRVASGYYVQMPLLPVGGVQSKKPFQGYECIVM